MTVAVAFSEYEVLAALIAWLRAILPPSVEVVRGQENRVPVPNAREFVVVTPIGRTRQGTNTIGYRDDPGAGFRDSMQPTVVDFQIDIFGAGSAGYVQIVSTLARDDHVFRTFKERGVPARMLYAGEPRQLPWTDEGKQYEDRWQLDVSIQANIVVQVSQQFADRIVVDLVPADGGLYDVQ